jgi:CheY-like chemotaxis protein
MKRIQSNGLGGDRLSSPPQPGRPLILYVEDEDDNWVVAKLRLQTKYDVRRAQTDRDACLFVRTHHRDLYAILMDIQLKGSSVDGVQLARLFITPESATPGTPPYARDLPAVRAPLFFVTAYATTYSEASLQETGASACITKPVDFVKLMRALTSAHLQTVDRR